MPNYSEHQLKDFAEMEQLRSKHGTRFADFEERIYKRMDTLPHDEWIDYTMWVCPENIPLAIKVICYYINCISRPADDFLFNNEFSLVRRRINSTAYE
jgi:Cys-tRNA synthase (O-phospho-L-seryl-tRNA:Cys-tRNA synthase)